MLRTRNRVATLLACAAISAIAAQAFADNPGVILNYNAAKMLGDVKIANGWVDLTNGALIVTTSSFGFVPVGGPSNPNDFGTPGVAEYGANAIHDAVYEGFNIQNGYWDGTNGIRSSAAANDTNGFLGVGYIDNSLFGYTSFRGVPVNANQTIIATTYYGDADLNGVVDASDYGFWSGTASTHTTLAGGPPMWADGNFSFDAVTAAQVGANDYGFWSGNASLNLPPLGFNVSSVGASAVASAPASVPEPATLSLMASLVACGLVAFRVWRRRS
jgi:hypothetical protein